MIEFIIDKIEFILIAIMIVLLGIAVNEQNKDNIKCEQNGGIVIKKFMGYQCITKQDIENIKEENNESSSINREIN